MRFFKTILAVAMAVAICPAAPAAETMDLAKARTLALANSKTLQKAGLAVEAALLAEKTLGYDLLPSVNASAGAALAYPQADFAKTLSASAGVSVTQSVWDGGRNAVLAAIDRLATAAAREEARAAYFSVLDAVDAAYYAALEARASLESGLSGVAASRLALSIAQAKLEAGMITKVDLIQVEAETAAKETAVSGARRDLAIDMAKIASLTGAAAGFDLADVDFSRFDALIGKVAGYGDAASDALTASIRMAADAANPGLLRTGLENDKARSSVDLAAVDYVPTVSAGFTHRLSVSSAGFDATQGSLSVSASVPLNYWSRETAVETREVAARQAALDLEEIRRSLDLDALSAVAECAAQARTVRSSSMALEYAESNYDSVLTIYKLSSKPVSDLLDAEALVGSNRNQLIAARYGFLSCLSTLRSLGAFESDEALLALFP